jgi:hypothetical protein
MPNSNSQGYLSNYQGVQMATPLPDDFIANSHDNNDLSLPIPPVSRRQMLTNQELGNTEENQDYVNRLRNTRQHNDYLNRQRNPEGNQATNDDLEEDLYSGGRHIKKRRTRKSRTRKSKRTRTRKLRRIRKRKY